MGDWTEHADPGSGKTYYYNAATGATSCVGRGKARKFYEDPTKTRLFACVQMGPSTGVRVRVLRLA